MHARALPGERKPVSGTEWDFQQQMRAWRQMLAQCTKKPGRKCVHSLRVATLRLQAAVEFWLNGQQPGEVASRPARRWLRQAKKLRRALGPVRQGDVSLAMLKRVRRWVDPAANGPLVLPKESLGALGEIERGIKRRRALAAKKLVAEIEQRHKRLLRLSWKIERSLNSFSPAAAGQAENGVQARIVSMAAEFPVLNADNLHDLRKQIKKIRYVAEIFAPGDPEIARQVTALRRMTGALGEWHDWQILAQQASSSQHGEVAAYLQAQADQSFDKALKLCRQSIARLMGREAISPSSCSDPGLETLSPRKPVAPVPNGVHRAHPERSLRAS